MQRYAQIHADRQAFASQQQSRPCGATSHRSRLFYVLMSTLPSTNQKQKNKKKSQWEEFHQHSNRAFSAIDRRSKKNKAYISLSRR